MVDALSSSLQEVHLESMSSCIAYIKERVNKALSHDKHYLHVKTCLQKELEEFVSKIYQINDDGKFLFKKIK